MKLGSGLSIDCQCRRRKYPELTTNESKIKIFMEGQPVLKAILLFGAKDKVFERPFQMYRVLKGNIY